MAWGAVAKVKFTHTVLGTATGKGAGSGGNAGREKNSLHAVGDFRVATTSGGT